MSELKLLALDGEDLAVISAHMQDSVFKVGDMSYSPRPGQFTLTANRFDWEEADRKAKAYQRHRTVLVFKRVQAVRSAGVDLSRADEVLSLLAIRFSQLGQGPGGTVELTLAGKASIALDVECIELQLADVGGAWETASRPSHPDGK